MPPETSQTNIDKLAEFLANIGEAWREASGEQRNKMARTLFQEVWIKDTQAVAVKPQPELEPFFKVNYEEFVNKVLKKRPRWDSGTLNYTSNSMIVIYTTYIKRLLRISPE